MYMDELRIRQMEKKLLRSFPWVWKLVVEKYEIREIGISETGTLSC